MKLKFIKQHILLSVSAPTATAVAFLHRAAVAKKRLKSGLHGKSASLHHPSVHTFQMAQIFAA